jgi:hypothetical protein
MFKNRMLRRIFGHKRVVATKSLRRNFIIGTP